MFKMFKRLNPFYRKKRRYNKRRYNYYKPQKASSHNLLKDDVSILFRDLHDLERKVDKLIKVSGFKDVNGIIMDAHEAKKYEDQDNVGF